MYRKEYGKDEKEAPLLGTTDQVADSGSQVDKEGGENDKDEIDINDPSLSPELRNIYY
jgi:hypothetical protein